MATIVTIAQLWGFSHVISGTFVQHRPIPALHGAVLLLVLLTALRAGLGFLQQLAAQEGALRLKSAVRARLLRAIMRQASGFTGLDQSGSLVATVMDGSDKLDAYAGSYVPLRSLSVLQPLVILVFLVPLDWVSALIMLFTVPVIPLLMLMVGNYTAQRVERQWGALIHMSGVFLDTIQGLATIKAFGRSAAFGERIQRASIDFRDRTMQVLKVAFLSGLVLDFITSVAVGVVAVALGARLLTGGISFESALLVLLLAPEFYRPLRELGSRRHAAMEGASAAEAIVQLLGEDPDARDTEPGAAGREGVAEVTLFVADSTHGQAAPVAVAPQVPNPPVALRFSHVSYTYEGRTVPALDDVSVTLAAGTRTAVVGRTGSGKSTLVNLLLRSLEPSSGVIEVNGSDIRTLGLVAWREQIAVVPQRPHLFHGSILDNLLLARPDATRDEVWDALELAGAQSFVVTLPDGLATTIGERGNGLSSGEVQRLAIARAFLKDAPLLALDEPTSSLDPRSERLIRDAMQRLTTGRTVLVVAHRLATLLGTDQIVVLEAGRVVGIGTHDVLARSCSEYTALLGARALVTA
jgi:ATP-binding cassette subfamily C protein CydD